MPTLREELPFSVYKMGPADWYNPLTQLRDSLLTPSEMHWSRTLKLNYNLCIEPKSNVVIMRSCLSISSFWTQLSPLFFFCALTSSLSPVPSGDVLVALPSFGPCPKRSRKGGREDFGGAWAEWKFALLNLQHLRKTGGSWAASSCVDRLVHGRRVSWI